MKERMRAVFRVDATSEIGAGHAMRCLALALALRRLEVEVAAYGDLAPDIHSRFIVSGVQVCLMSDAEKADPVLARQQFAKQLARSEEGVIWAVFDGYHLGNEDHHNARCAGARILVIDDYGHLLEYDADILLNQNISAANVDYAVPPHCVRLNGLRYVLMRPEFEGKQGAAKAKEKGGLPDVLVTLGAADPQNITQAILQGLPEALFDSLRLHVLVGGCNPNAVALSAWVASLHENVVVHQAVDDMPGLLSRMDLAITAAGSTCWELILLGVPFVTIVIAENQREIAAELDRCGVAPCAGTISQGKSDVIAFIRNYLFNFINSIDNREEQLMRGKQILDGRGAERVARIMLGET